MNPREEALMMEARKHVNESKTMAPMPTNGCEIQAASRERTSREVLAELCMMKQVEADELNELLKALPAELPYRADRALRRLIQTR